MEGRCLKIFISGGNKSGKSLYAQRLSQKMRKKDRPLYYLATMIPTDSEDEERINRHRRERVGCGFETIEVGYDIIAAVEPCDWSGTFLLDSVTALLANAMFNPRNGDNSSDRDAPKSRIDQTAHKKVAADLTKIISELSDIVIVSDYIYSDAFLYDELTETYRSGLAYIDKQVARLSDVVLEICSGNRIIHKGLELLGETE